MKKVSGLVRWCKKQKVIVMWIVTSPKSKIKLEGGKYNDNKESNICLGIIAFSAMVFEHIYLQYDASDIRYITSCMNMEMKCTI